jgi:hypothetical protein
MYRSRLLLAIFFFGLIGLAAELLLLGHFEDTWQSVPLALIALALVITPWYARSARPASLRAFRWLLLLFGAGGVIGLILHYRGNVEFEKERDPALGGLRLFWEAITGATPALSPGTMILFAAIGYAATVAGTSPFRGDGPEPH